MIDWRTADHPPRRHAFLPVHTKRTLLQLFEQSRESGQILARDLSIVAWHFDNRLTAVVPRLGSKRRWRLPLDFEPYLSHLQFGIQASGPIIQEAAERFLQCESKLMKHCLVVLQNG